MLFLGKSKQGILGLKLAVAENFDNFGMKLRGTKKSDSVVVKI